MNSSRFQPTSQQIQQVLGGQDLTNLSSQQYQNLITQVSRQLNIDPYQAQIIISNYIARKNPIQLPTELGRVEMGAGALGQEGMGGYMGQYYQPGLFGNVIYEYGRYETPRY